jgi:MarR family 2-MHQ and catechol resistance regulon transcriptional repressor
MMTKDLKKIQRRPQASAGDHSGVHLWLVLWKAFDALQEHALGNIASLGLGLSDFAILEVLLHKGSMAVNTIGSRVRLTSGSISVAIDRLEAKGLVERRNDPADRRARVVHLTKEGRKLIECAFAAHAAAMEEATSALSVQERVRAIALLKKLGTGAAERSDRGRSQHGAFRD